MATFTKTNTAKKPTVRDVLRLERVVLSFPDLFSPVEKFGKTKYSANFLIAKNDPQVPAIKAQIAALVKKAWPEGTPEILKTEKDRICLRDGDKGSAAGWAGYPGHYYIPANNLFAPQLFDENAYRIGEESDDYLQSGDIVNAKLALYITDDKVYKQRVNASLDGIQHVKIGERFTKQDESEPMFTSLTGEAPAFTPITRAAAAMPTQKEIDDTMTTNRALALDKSQLAAIEEVLGGDVFGEEE